MNTIGSYVFIDTSVFQEEGFFKPSGKVSKLFNLAENGKLNILMPEITRQEWLKHYKQIMYLQPIITQYFIGNKSEIWSLSLIVHSKG